MHVQTKNRSHTEFLCTVLIGHCDTDDVSKIVWTLCKEKKEENCSDVEQCPLHFTSCEAVSHSVVPLSSPRALTLATPS